MSNRRTMGAGGWMIFALWCLGDGALQSAAAAEAAAPCDTFKIKPKEATPLATVETPGAGGCKTETKHGYPVPDPKCTPGAINGSVTASVLQNPAFRTSCIRNELTSSSDKEKTYGWYKIVPPKTNKGVMQVCELDHLISLELGGADSLENIWPQCGPSGVVLRERYFKEKDAVENYLARQVRQGLMALQDAQNGIAEDWTQYLDEATKACKGSACQ